MILKEKCAKNIADVETVLDKVMSMEAKWCVCFAKRMEMAVVNTWFLKGEECRVTHR